MSTALTSTRLSIRFPPDPAYEDAHVTVLTSPRGFYVDVRVCNDVSSTPGVLQLAAAGRKDKFDNGKARWTQYLTSGPPLPDNAEEAVTRPHPDDPTLALEEGMMDHPVTGEHRPFEEIWRDIDSAPGDRVLVLELVDDDDKEDNDSPSPGPGVKIPRRGWIVQVGERYLGIVSVNGEWHTLEAEWDGDGWVVSRATGPGGPGAELLENVVPRLDVGLGVEEDVVVGRAGGGRWVLREVV